MSESILKLTDAEFENQVIKSEKPILVDYWAEWCGPCKMIAPVLEEVASELSDKILIGKLNVDENSETPPKYGIRGIPTLMLFKNGEVVGTQVGAISKSDLINFIENNI
ncbi:MAG: thioredoxin TrxA [Gammaproteobacteria bacterium]|jgi:thioredoxin 1|tara:strand:+ start:18672 stop:18998 length:327 start_codon:yes stop_codon:yes gene_type:complete